MSIKYLVLLIIGLAHLSVDASESILNRNLVSSSIKLVSGNKSGQYENMFKMERKTLSLQVAGVDGVDLEVDGDLSYYEAKIPASKQVVSYLIDIGMQESSAESIALMLAEGVKNSDQCVGNRSSCLVSSLNVQFVVDYYNAMVRIFPTSTMFSKPEVDIRLTPSISGGFVSQFYGNVSYMDDAQYYVNSDNVFGLGFGYVSGSVRLNETQNVLEKLNYTYEGDGFTSSIGLMDGNQSLGIASQGRLITSDYIGYAFSNKDALQLRNLSERSVNFFSSIEGDYEVLKEGEVIHRGFARAGENKISYSQLPQGAYRISIQVKHNENMLVIGEDYVTNINNYQAGEVSYYLRTGLLKDYRYDAHDVFFADSGISIPMTDMSSVTANLALIDDSLFVGGGAYANFLRANASASAYVSDEQFQATFALYSGMFNLNGSYDFDRSNVDLAIKESASLFTGLSHQWGDFNFNVNLGYTNNDDVEYMSYNVGVGYFSPKGWSLQTNVTNPYDDIQVQMVVNIPLAYGAHNSLSAFTHDDDVTWRNSLSGSYNLSDDLSVNGTVNTDFPSHQTSQTDIRLGANYSSEYVSSSANVNKIGEKKGFSSSISTTAYVTGDGLRFKSSLSDENTFIEVVSKNGTPINGRLKIKDSLTQSTQEVFVNSDETIKIKDYSRKKLIYEFDSYEYRLIDANMKSGVELDFTPGKVHQLIIDQAPIGNVLVVWNPALSDAPICEGDGCIEQQKINAHVSRFVVMPNTNVRIKGGSMVCFDGQVEHGETKKGICRS
ncbi:TcfC E-set like domain-containing protein [Vibrio owensii]|uniref:TcfC E-set like domain-containing protein n=1 Tax=Vibrio owensii TaxID=696485 RepID=UPI003AADA79B